METKDGKASGSVDLRELLCASLEGLLKSSLPLALFHYTSQDGLLGILNGGFLRATKATYLNDTSEIRHGLELFESIVQDFLRCRTDADDRKRALDGMIQGVIRGATTTAPMYVTCFSAECNDLSQWRAYSSHGGFAIEFEASRLGSMKIQHLGQQYRWTERAIYDDDEKRRVLTAAVTIFLGLFSKHSIEEANYFSPEFYAFVLRCVSCFKNVAFKQENEFRIIFTMPPPKEAECVEFYTRSTLLVPFCRVAVTGDLLPINRIWVGPTSDHVLSGHSVKLLLRKNGYPDSVAVEQSLIPLRNSIAGA